MCHIFPSIHFPTNFNILCTKGNFSALQKLVKLCQIFFFLNKQQFSSFLLNARKQKKNCKKLKLSELFDRFCFCNKSDWIGLKWLTFSLFLDIKSLFKGKKNCYKKRTEKKSWQHSSKELTILIIPSSRQNESEWIQRGTKFTSQLVTLYRPMDIHK